MAYENWLREYRVIAGVGGSTGFEIGQTVRGRALHVEFDFEKSETESSNTGKITISNLNDEHKAILNEKGCTVEVRAGYMSRMYPIFKGDVSETNESLNDADRDLEIELVDGLSQYDVPGTISLNGVNHCITVLEIIQREMGIDSCIITEKASAALEKAKYDNGYAFAGKMKSAMTKVCRKAGVQFTLQNGILHVYCEGEAVTNHMYVLSAETGLISIPKKITISKNGASSTGSKKSSSKSGKKGTTEKGIPGYEVEYFMNGAIGINDLVQLQSRKVSGTFKVHKIHYKGDNYKGDWKCVTQLVEVT